MPMKESAPTTEKQRIRTGADPLLFASLFPKAVGGDILHIGSKTRIAAHKGHLQSLRFGAKTGKCMIYCNYTTRSR